MSNNEVNTDLNKTIAAAVNAKIEAVVAAELASDDLMKSYVAAALQQEIDVRDRSSYRDRKTTFLRHTIDEAVRAAAKAAVEKFLEEEIELLEAEVRKTLRRDAQAIAGKVVGGIADKAKSAGISVEVRYPNHY